MGFEVLATDYAFPAQIHSEQAPTTCQHTAFLNVLLVGRKQAPTPVHYIYEFDSE